ncbi:acyl-CoA thioester hydrolase/BAAT C-terminal domain-containing protein [Lentibacillus amyloliquefaciens]|uniref:acyl-CoA thioester hydrolase/BAAT C-terminal domain-containing protein n=1 Tax=Lentibacillus amyloliquefaciens TaxID=1472767 RepID=UPI0009E84C07
MLNICVKITVRKEVFYEGAGHFSSFPYSFPSIPSNVVMQLGSGMAMTFDGSKSANARATTDSWKK